MAYQQVGTPRFYINNLEWLASHGELRNNAGISGTSLDAHFRTLPVDQQPFGASPQYAPSGVFGEKSFVALLGHRLGTDTNSFHIDGVGSWDDHLINQPNADGPASDGFSISTFNGLAMEELNLQLANWGTEIGSIIFGTYYDMPHSPDLSLSLTYEYDNYTEVTTKGGSTLTNSYYHQQPKWGSLAAWELSTAGYPTPAQGLAQSGRRIWDLSFSYLDDGDAFGPNQHLSSGEDWGDQSGAGTFDDDDLTGSSGFKEHILTDYNFYSVVVHRTNGGQLPFIFQPNKNDNSVFAICKFDQNSFKFDQVANGVYNVTMKIREVW